MSLKRRQSDLILKGEWVVVARMGRKPSFTGEVVERRGKEYIVRDAENRRWVRNASQIERAKGCDGCPSPVQCVAHW